MDFENSKSPLIFNEKPIKKVFRFFHYLYIYIFNNFFKTITYEKTIKKQNLQKLTKKIIKTFIKISKDYFACMSLKLYSEL